MAARRNVNAYRFFTSTPTTDRCCLGEDEFDESDIWGLAQDYRPSDLRISIPPSRLVRNKSENRGQGGGAVVAASLPVNIPEWTKILQDEQNRGSGGRKFLEYDGGEDDDGKGRGPVIPPHELLWRSRAASFSVHEGIGRTLKGRDLSRVRDAIWQRTGFED